MPEEKEKTIGISIQKIFMTVLTAAVIASFGWIIKIETHMTRVKADIEDIEDDIKDVEADVAAALAISQKVQDNRLDLTSVQGLVQSINDKVDDIKRALERLGNR